MFKNNKNSTEIDEKICSVSGHSVITECQVQNWFSVFHSSNTSLMIEPRSICSSDLNLDALRELVVGW